MFSLIACVGKHNELGKNNQLIFHLKDDMKFFRETTSQHPVIMGRKTWDSLPGKLKNRTNIVISHRDFDGPDLIVHDAIAFAEEHADSPEEYFVIGGGSIYKMFLPYAKNIYLTEVEDSAYDADTFFPNFDKSKYHHTLIRKGKENDLEYSIFQYTKR